MSAPKDCRIIGTALLALAAYLGFRGIHWGALVLLVIGGRAVIVSFQWVDLRPDCIATNHRGRTRTVPWSEVASIEVHQQFVGDRGRHAAVRLTTGGWVNLGLPVSVQGIPGDSYYEVITYMQQWHVACGHYVPPSPPGRT